MCVCTSVCVYTSVFVYVCLCMRVRVREHSSILEAKGQCHGFLRSHLPCVLETGRLAGQPVRTRDPSICVSPRLELQAMHGTYTWVLGVKLEPSSLWDKYFAN